MATTPLNHNSNFMKLWIGQTISLVGSAITSLALPLTALTLLHATPLDMGLLLACSAGASALMGFFAGALADRLPRQGMLLGSDLCRATIIVAIPVIYQLGLLSVPVLFGAAVVTGIFNSLFVAAYRGFVPDIVGRDALVGANSRLEGSRVLAMLIGSLLSGILVELLTTPDALYIDAASFLVSAASLAMIHPRSHVAAGAPEQESMLRSIGTGLRFVLGNRYLRTLLMLAALFNLFAPMLNGQFVLYVTGTLGIAPGWFGAGAALAGGAGMLMATVAPRIMARLGLGRGIIIAAAIVGGGWALMPLASGPFALAFGIVTTSAVIGTMGDVLINIGASSLSQSLTPGHLLGRVGASIGVIVSGLQPIGALVGGVLAQYLGVRLAIAIFGGGFLFTFVIVALSPLRHLPRTNVAPEPAAPESVAPVLEGALLE